MDDVITRENFEDGSLLMPAIRMFNEERTEDNLLRILAILRDSLVWIPCNAILADPDKEAIMKMVEEAGDSPDGLVGKTFSNADNIRMVPDILMKDDDFFFPVFTTAEEMGEYGDHFSKIQESFLRAINLATNNEKDVIGIIINAFTEPFLITKDLFSIVGKFPSIFEEPVEE